MLTFTLIVLTSLIFTGIIGRTKSILSGRKGPGILQPIKNVILLLRKGSVFSTSSSAIQQIAPIISLTAVITASMLLPLAGHPGIVNTSWDFVIFAYLMGLGRFFMIIGALDAGSSFEGMGASREVLYGMLLEPAFFILIASLAMLTGYTSFQDIFTCIGEGNAQYLLAAVLAIFILGNIAIIENSRMPVDDPKTHLELTMIHEVMILDMSGFDLALVHIGSYMKFAVYGTLIANCIIPSRLPLVTGIILFMLIQCIFAMIIGFVESFRARNKMNKNPQYILALTAVSLVIFVLALLIKNEF